MGYLWGIFDRPRRQEQTLAYIQCAPGCRGSDKDPRYCQCVCRGLNHGSLVYGRSVRPVPVPQGYNPDFQYPEEASRYALPAGLQALPEIKPVPVEPVKPRPETERLIFPVARASGKVGKKIGKSFLKALALGQLSEDEQNEAILNGLRRQFSAERVDAIVTESFTDWYSHNPESNTPELYELYENGNIDSTLDRRGLRWVVGRPRQNRGR